MKSINVNVLNKYIHVQNTQRITINYTFDIIQLYINITNTYLKQDKLNLVL